MNKTERNLNYHSKSVTRIFKIGERYGQHKRAVQKATVHVNGQIHSLEGAEKDHKESETDIKMRVIFNAIHGPKKNVSNTLSDVLFAVAEAYNDGTLCSSTEKLLEAFKAYNENKNRSKEKRKLGSMDAVSFNPSLEAN